MVLRERVYTVEQFREIAQLPENENRRLELEDGIIIEIASSKPINTIVAGRIITFLNNYIMPKNLGIVTVPDGGFKLSPDTSRQPDVAFVPIEQVEVIPNEFNFAPALAVEVVSPSEDVFKKVNEYLASGTSIVWAVYCDEKRVYVFTRNNSGIIQSEPKDIGDILEGGKVLPNFTLAVKDIFPDNMS